MISSVKINDNNKTPFKYVSNIKAFTNGSEFTFKPGVNVIIGKNGSGKSTLINIISMYMLCERSMCSEAPIEVLDFPHIFDEDKVFDGIDIKADYVGKAFRLMPYMEMNQSEILNDIHNFSLYMNGSSSSFGEKGICSIESLFDFMFKQKDYSFPINKLKERKEKMNDLWVSKIDNLIDYYKKNHIEVTEKSFEYTVLMDEPDRNLDIENIMQIYDILSFHKPQTQIIAVIHNPSLIYKLWDTTCVNFIEMTKGYLNDVISFIRK